MKSRKRKTVLTLLALILVACTPSRTVLERDARPCDCDSLTRERVLGAIDCELELEACNALLDTVDRRIDDVIRKEKKESRRNGIILGSGAMGVLMLLRELL